MLPLRAFGVREHSRNQEGDIRSLCKWDAGDTNMPRSLAEGASSRAGLRSDGAAVGIGAMLVFISMVIVASIAAAVIVHTAENLQRKSKVTGRATAQAVSSNLLLRDIIGNVTDADDDGTDEITNVHWYVDLAPGADPVDLTELVVRWEHGENLTDLQHNAGTCSQGLQDGFCIVDVHDAGDQDPDTLSDGDRVRIHVNLNVDAGEHLTTRDSANVLLIPSRGSPVNVGFNTPSSFGTRSNLSLR